MLRKLRIEEKRDREGEEERVGEEEGKGEEGEKDKKELWYDFVQCGEGDESDKAISELTRDSFRDVWNMLGANEYIISVLSSPLSPLPSPLLLFLPPPGFFPSDVALHPSPPTDHSFVYASKRKRESRSPHLFGHCQCNFHLFPLLSSSLHFSLTRISFSSFPSLQRSRVRLLQICTAQILVDVCTEICSLRAFAWLTATWHVCIFEFSA